MTLTQEELDWPDVDVVMERVRRWDAELRATSLWRNEMIRRHQPILAGEWRDHNQCLPIATEAVLRLPRGSLPPIREGEDRFDRWHEEIQRLGYRIEEIPLEELPPPGPWIAAVGSGETVDHAVPVLGWTSPERSLTPEDVRAAYRVVEVA